MDEAERTATEARRLALAERFFAAVVSGDLATVRACYSADAVIWHNYDQAEQDVDANLAVLAAIPRIVTNFRYEDVVRAATSDGFIEQHVVRATTRFGEELNIPSCIVCRVRDGLIVRLDEYFDSAHIAPMLRRA